MNAISAFITKWSASGAAERANAQLFVAELCHLLGVEAPHPKTPEEHANAYVFEKTIPGADGSKNFIDCYKRGHFVLEAKQGADVDDSAAPLSAAFEQQRAQRKTGHGKRGTAAWDTAMERARKQAENYARRLPREEMTDGGRPPFIMVVDVGHSIALYSDWSRAGGHYVPFPDPASYRISLADLHHDYVRERLQTVWINPLDLDPSRRSARVTRHIADRLARLARSLEGAYEPERVAGFLMRSLFTMFAEDVDLLPKGSFTKLLDETRHDPPHFPHVLGALWRDMNSGGYSVALRAAIPRFNGGLFAEADVLDLNADQIQLLAEAAQADWRDVEPAIFGTLLERALDPHERHKLGAHYTPRAYVERLVMPTVIEPLRAEWEAVQVAALQQAEDGQNRQAIAEVEGFLQKLAHLRILDPACGSGNFLYVTLELLKRLEGEVLNTLRELGQGQLSLELAGVMVTPANLLGIELNPRAAAIAELVLWIGFLQWHLRTRGTLQGLPEPIIRDLHNVENRDAVLDWDARLPQLDNDGNPVTRWDGRTTKTHPVTGEQVPDPEARVPVYAYTNPRPAEWPEADYIVGNPPFIGNKRMRLHLGDGYTDALRKAYGKLPATIDLVMYWWEKSAKLLSQKAVKGFGLITTNSITQIFNRVIISEEVEKNGISISFAIPDHPWVDSSDGAAVRIAMTVAHQEKAYGDLLTSISEKEIEEGVIEVAFLKKRGKILPDLSIGADLVSTAQLKSNMLLSGQGVIVLGDGFLLDEENYRKLLQFDPESSKFIKRYRNGSDILRKSRNLRIIDLFGLTENEVKQYPNIYHTVYTRVRPMRLEMKDKARRERWWLFGRSNKEIRDAIYGLDRYIATCRTAKHRIFMFLEGDILPDAKIVAIGLNDAYYLGIISSRLHLIWALATGAFLEDRPNYNHSDCFNKFPFPTPTEAQTVRIRDLGERLDAHRKRQQGLFPDLTMTDMYNVLEKVRSGEPLTEKERRIHEQGLVGILKQLHDELDAAVAEAYGWPADLPKAEILERLVRLNAERAAEEASGLVRWLRPEYQAPGAAAAGVQGKLLDDEEGAAPEAVAAEVAKRVWPESLAAQAAVLRDVLQSLDAPAEVSVIAGVFEGKKTAKRLEQIQRLLETLAALGQAVEVRDGVWGR